jgi:hypothetical protein
MIQPSASIGQISINCSEMNATSPPTVMAPVATANAPPTSTMASVTLGTASNSAQLRASSLALRTPVSCTRRASAANRVPMCRRRPNDLMTRTPCADSSTSVARSPCWSCWSREIVR